MAESNTAMGVYCSASNVDTNPATMAVKLFNVDAVLNVKFNHTDGESHIFMGRNHPRFKRGHQYGRRNSAQDASKN